ncbi:TPA: hypothetical protein ACUNCG_000538 [Aeromonas hydrophila]|uniref:hypothetical protein n=1 Tax=Aeromonas sp. QDB03 TaxID=2989839 RepID=UPI0022E951D8|nr:hypothetical protein [Aeromonas sp. QDB03]
MTPLKFTYMKVDETFEIVPVEGCTIIPSYWDGKKSIEVEVRDNIIYPPKGYTGNIELFCYDNTDPDKFHLTEVLVYKY